MPLTIAHQSLTILLLEPDDDTRPLLKGNLENWGYTVLTALDEQDALQRATYSPTIDLILINQCDASLEAAIAIGQQIRQSSNLSASTPVVILAEDYGSDLEGQNVPINDSQFIAYLEDAQQLSDLLHRLLSRPERS